MLNDNKTYIFDKKNKKKRLNTPVKEYDSRRRLFADNATSDDTGVTHYEIVDSDFYLFLRLVQINLVFSDNVQVCICIVYLSLTSL